MMPPRILEPPLRHPVDFRLLIFDADGTLRRCTVPGQPRPTSRGQWELLPNVLATFRAYHFQSHFFGIASHQGGVALGDLTEMRAWHLLRDLAVEVFGCALVPQAIQLCPHAPQAACVCRKPQPLLLHRIAAAYDIPYGLTLYVGDQESDRETAERAGLAFCWGKTFFHWRPTP